MVNIEEKYAREFDAAVGDIVSMHESFDEQSRLGPVKRFFHKLLSQPKRSSSGKDYVVEVYLKYDMSVDEKLALLSGVEVKQELKKLENRITSDPDVEAMNPKTQRELDTLRRAYADCRAKYAADKVIANLNQIYKMSDFVLFGNKNR